MIEVENLTRVFRTYKKQPGFWGGVKGLFKRDFEETRARTTSASASGRASSSGSSGPTAQARPRRSRCSPASSTDERLGARRGLRSDQTRERIPPAVRPGPRPEEPAVVGPARHRVVLPAPRHLRPRPRGLPADPRRTRHPARRRAQAQCHGPRAFARRTDEDGTDRGAPAPPARALPRRAHHRPRRRVAEDVREFLRDYNRRNKTTILLTSHYMADISSLCERVIVIDHGKKIYDGDLDRIAGAGARQRIIRFKPRDGAFPPAGNPPKASARSARMARSSSMSQRARDHRLPADPRPRRRRRHHHPGCAPRGCHHRAVLARRRGEMTPGRPKLRIAKPADAHQPSAQFAPMLDAPSILPTTAADRPKVLVIDDELGPRESISYCCRTSLRCWPWTASTAALP